MAIKEVGQNASEISSKAVSETAPTNGQVLKYNSTSGEWEPGAETDTDTQLTQEQVEDYVNGLIVAGSNVTKTYDDAAGTLTIASTGGGAALDGIDDQSSSNDDQITITDTEVVINDDSDDLDFRVESNGNANMLFVDGGGDTVGIGCTPVEAGANNPSALLVVSNRGTPSTPAGYSPLVVENDAAAAYVNVISNDNGWQGIIFGDQTDPDEAGIKYNSSNKRMYITGNAEAVASNVLTIDHSANTVGINVGAPAAGALDVDGAVALKSQGSDPSTSEDYSKLFAKDLVGADCSLLLHCDTASFVDTSVNGLTTTVTGATCDTSDKKFGAGSLTLDGSNDYVTVAASSGFSWGTDHTVEMWLNFVDAGDSVNMFHSFGSASVKGFCSFTKEESGESGNGALAIWWNTGGGWSDVTLVYSSAFPTGWHHYAFVKEGSTWTGYLDGTSFDTTSDSSTLPANFGTTDLLIGRYQNSGGSYAYQKAKIDDLRISQTAQYTGNFTPRASAFPSSFSELYASDEQGNVTKISPHNPQGEWEYYSKNTKTGKTVRINMEEVVRDLGELTGKDYIKDV